MQHEPILQSLYLRKVLVVFIFLAPVNLFLSCQNQVVVSNKTQKEVHREVPRDWQRIETEFFSFSIPANMKNNDVRGIDSYVMQFENDEIILDLDYGMHSTTMEYSASSFESKKDSIIIDGTETLLISYDANKPVLASKAAVNADGSTKFEKVEKNYVIGISFPYESRVIPSKEYFAASFIANCKTLEAQETAKTILYSIKFKKT